MLTFAHQECPRCAACASCAIVTDIFETPEKPKDSYAGALHEILRQIKLALRGYADEWYAALDHLYGLAIIATLFVFTVLPLAALQSRRLYNRNFMAVIAERTRRRRFLEELLG